MKTATLSAHLATSQRPKHRARGKASQTSAIRAAAAASRAEPDCREQLSFRAGVTPRTAFRNRNRLSGLGMSGWKRMLGLQLPFAQMFGIQSGGIRQRAAPLRAAGIFVTTARSDGNGLVGTFARANGIPRSATADCLMTLTGRLR